MSMKEVDHQQDGAATCALRERRRIEAAVDCGDLPAWVLESCDAWERAAMHYGAAMAKRSERYLQLGDSPSSTCH